MNAVILLSVLVIIPWFVASQENHDEPRGVHVDIYYEALCPDSQKFFNEQFHPNIHLIAENAVSVGFIPYGKMTHDLDQTTNQWISTCRHSPTECQGHKVHACAISISPPPITLFEYISCLMKRGRKNKSYPAQECADQLKTSSLQIDYDYIGSCSNSSTADAIIEQYKKATAALVPPLKSVPHIVFNGKNDAGDQKLAESNFKAALCKHLSANHQDVEACSSTSSAEGHAVTLTLLVSALAAILIVFRIM